MKIKKFFKTCNRKCKKLNMWDIGMIKWSSILAGAIVGAYFAGFVKINLLWIIGIIVVLVIKPIVKLLKA